MSFSSSGILLSFSFWFARVLLCSARKALIFSSWLVPCACTPFKWDAQGTDIVVVDVYVDEDELERDIGEYHLTHSRATGVITIQDHLVNLV